MAVSSQTRSGDLSATLSSEREITKEQIKVAMPGIIQSFDPKSVTAVVQPAIRCIQRGNDGVIYTSDYPMLVDVPVVFPTAGGVTLTFPVNPGDECELKFQDRCIDFFWQSGGVQEPVDVRIHDLSDATCTVGQISQPNRIKNVSTTSAQLRTVDGSTYIDLNPSTKKIKLVAPGGFDVVSPESTFSAKVTITGLLTWMGGMVGSLSSGTAAKITGAIEFFGSLKSNNKTIDDSHTHDSVQPGTGQSGKVS